MTKAEEKAPKSNAATMLEAAMLALAMKAHLTSTMINAKKLSQHEVKESDQFMETKTPQPWKAQAELDLSLEAEEEPSGSTPVMSSALMESLKLKVAIQSATLAPTMALVVDQEAPSASSPLIFLEQLIPSSALPEALEDEAVVEEAAAGSTEQS